MELALDMFVIAGMLLIATVIYVGLCIYDNYKEPKEPSILAQVFGESEER